MAELGLSDTPEAVFLYMQSLSKDDLIKALLPSLAVPVLYSLQDINDR
jgi:hypothetical protein